MCIAADIVRNTVNDATVSTTDGANADLHIFISNNVDRWKYNSRNFRTEVYRAYDSGTLVCGEAWAEQCLKPVDVDDREGRTFPVIE